MFIPIARSAIRIGAKFYHYSPRLYYLQAHYNLSVKGKRLSDVGRINFTNKFDEPLIVFGTNIVLA